MINKLLKVLAVAQAVAFSAVNVQKAAKPTTGYQIYEGQYVSEILIGDISHAYINWGCWNLATFSDSNDNSFLFGICINENSTVKMAYIDGANKGLIDWERSGLSYNGEWRYVIDKSYFCLYFKKPLKATNINERTKQYLSYTSPAGAFAAGYDGFIPSFYYTSISGNRSFFDSIDSVSSLIRGNDLWKSGDVSSLNIEKDGFIIQYYHVYVSDIDNSDIYNVLLRAYAKSKDGNNSTEFNIKQLVYVNQKINDRVFNSYRFPYPVSTLETTQGYYNIIRSSGAYGITESMPTYQEGYKNGQGNPTFKSFIVSAFEACSAFFSLPVLGQNITIGTLIGSFVGLGALFLLIRLFR